MAKDLPYFKFYCSEWNDGDITLESFEIQGVFINVCSYYWSNECSVSEIKLVKKFKKQKKQVEILIKEGLIKSEQNTISINFLDEQWFEREEKSKKNSIAGKASAEKRKQNKIQQQSNKDLTNVENVLNENPTIKIREEEIRGDKKREKVYSDEVNECFLNCLNHFPLHLHPKNKNSWLDTIEKLNRIDNIPFEVITDITKKVRADDFWSKNFMSLNKLRQKDKKNDLMYIVIFNEKFNNNGKSNNSKGTRAEKFDKLMQERSTKYSGQKF